MANVYPDQEIDPLWCNTGTAFASGGEMPPLPCGNSTVLGGGLDPSPRNIMYSILIYIVVMMLVLLPLCPCFQCEERDYRDTKRYIKKRKAIILEDVITKPAKEHGTDQNNKELAPEEDASAHETFEIDDPDDEEVGEVGVEKVATCTTCVGTCVDNGSPSDDAVSPSLCATEDMADDDGTTLSLSHHSFASTASMCSICLEPFRIGEEVSWSRNTECLHCYHRGCISQWLLKHDECPVCRADYLFDDWKYNQLPSREPLLLWPLHVRRPPPKCTCPLQVEDEKTNKRTECVFCVTHGLESPLGVMISEDELPTACNLPSVDEKTGGDLEDVDLEAGDGGTNGGTGGENVLVHVANTKAIEEMQKKCPVHGRRHRSNRHRNRPQNDNGSDSSHWYEDRLRDTWWAMSSRHLGMRLQDSPSYAARSQFT